MRQGVSLDMIAAEPGAPQLYDDAEPETETTRQGQEDSRSTSSTSSPAPADIEESDFFLGANDSQSSLGVPNLQDMQVNDDECLPPVHRLPNEILIAIFSRLSTPSDLLHVMLTCKRWARNAVDILWHRPSCTSWRKHITICNTLSLERPYFYYRDFVRRLNLASLSDKVNDGSVLPLAACTRIERLTLPNCKHLTDAGLIPLVSNNTHLYSLDISSGEQITEASIYAIAKHCPRLQGLNISHCLRISSESLVRLAQACKYLKRLKLNECAQVTDEAVLAFAENCPNILEIDLQHCRQIGNEPVTAIFTKGQALRELRLVGCDLIDDSAFLSLPANRTYDHLRILDLSCCTRLTDRAVEKIIDVAPRLRNVVFSKCRNLTDASVYAISKLGKNLHYLHLGHCGNITDDAVKRLLASCNRIRYIDLGCCVNLTDDSVSRLATLPKLKRIGLVKCVNVTDASIIALANANRRPRLRKDAYGNVIPGEYTTSSGSLERVHLSYCTNLTLRSIIRLLNCCPRLTHLSLTGVQAFLREDLEQFSREAPADFTEHQRSVFCVFSGQGVVELRKYLNRLERERAEFRDMNLSVRGGPPTDGPIFPGPGNAPTGVPHLQSPNGGFDEGEVDAVEDDVLEDGSEMVIDTQPLLNAHNAGLGLSHHALNPHPMSPTPFDYVGGHPPYAPQHLFQDGGVIFPHHTPPPPEISSEQAAGGESGEADNDPATVTNTAGGAGPDSLPHPLESHSASEAAPSSGVTNASTPAFRQVDISSEPGPDGILGPVQGDQPPGNGGAGVA